jgi:hypothetical protein
MVEYTQSDQALIAYLTIFFFFLCPICAFVIYYYADKEFPYISYVTLFIGLFAALGILLLVPLDIALVVHDRRSRATDHDPTYQYHVHLLSQFYNVYFTTVLIMTSIVLAFEEYYNTDGYFTTASRLMSAFQRMVMDLILPAIPAAIILGILLGKHIVPSDGDALKLTLIILTNSIYEIGLMFLLAYSLVEYPRSIWLQSNYRDYLLKVQSKASHQFKIIKDTQFDVSMVVADVLKTKDAVKENLHFC